MHNHVGPAEYLVTTHFSLMGVDPRLTTHSCLPLPSWLQLCEKFRVNTSQFYILVDRAGAATVTLLTKEIPLRLLVEKKADVTMDSKGC